MEEGHLRELRHDFRAIYHAAYDEVDAGEALDLIELLPNGSCYLASVSPFRAWSDERRALADLSDLVRACLMRLSGDRSEIGLPLSGRPEDAALAEMERERARKAQERLSSTEWEAV